MIKCDRRRGLALETRFAGFNQLRDVFVQLKELVANWQRGMNGVKLVRKKFGFVCGLNVEFQKMLGQYVRLNLLMYCTKVYVLKGCISNIFWLPPFHNLHIYHYLLYSLILLTP